MATAAEFKQVQELFGRLTWRQCAKLLDDAMADPDQNGVRFWLAGGSDPDSEEAKAQRPIVMTSEAAEVLGVERQRLNRWEKQGHVRRVVTIPVGPLYARADVEALRPLAERGARRSRQEPEPEGDA